MLSPSLCELLQQAHVRYGLEVSVLGPELEVLFSAGEFDKVVAGSPAVRREIIQAQSTGRAHEFSHDGAVYRVWPLRVAGRDSGGGTLVFRTLPGTEGAWSEGTGWLLRALIEADLAAVKHLAAERQHARRHQAMLRFQKLLAEADSETAVALMLVQAAAVWFDADARVYRRDLRGEFVLHTSLPARPPGTAPAQLARALLASLPETARHPSQDGAADGSGRPTLVVPLRGGGPPEWILLLIGPIPSEWDAAIEVLSHVAGTRLDLLRQRRLDKGREGLRRVFSVAAPVERLALQAVRAVMDLTGASAATLTLVRGEALRRIVRIGPAEDSEPPPGEGVQSATRLFWTLPLAAGLTAWLDLRSAADGAFGLEAAEAGEAGAHLLHLWLRGAASLLTDLEEAPAAASHLFARRIHEELERAKRFDLRLSLIVVDVAPAASPGLAPVEQALRRALRGSDLLGTLAPHRLVALLTHTSSEGLTTVVQRLRRALSTIEPLEGSRVLLGHAAMSPECLTADALLSEAARQARPVVSVN